MGPETYVEDRAYIIVYLIFKRREVFKVSNHGFSTTLCMFRHYNGDMLH